MKKHALDIRFGKMARQPADACRYWELLDKGEKSRAERLRIDVIRERYVETHGRLRLLLGAAVDAAPERLKIAEAEHGKPYLADYPQIAFNLSHTADWMAVALSRNCRLGIDIEACKPRPNLAALVGKCFGAAETAHWSALLEHEKLPAFYGYWTRKEAFVKATGYGIYLGLHDCVIDPENPDRMLSVPSSCGAATDWSLRTLDLAPGLCGAVVTDGEIGEIKIESLDSLSFG